MNLVMEHAKKTHSDVHVTWFTAWDPGGIEDIGDAMLYRVFGDIAKNNDELSGAFDRLKEALKLRKSMKRRVGEALGAASKAVPGPAGAVADATGGLLLILDTPREIQDSFNDLVKWLEAKNQTVFLFIDDMDRTTGEEIRDLLSELKVYVSHHRIVGVVGYDEEYVLNALKTVIPIGIEPRKFLEKIVTIRRSLPSPNEGQLQKYETSQLHELLGLDQEKCEILGWCAADLCTNNPRRLKTLVLDFSDLLSSVAEYKMFESNRLTSALVVCAAERAGLFVDNNLRIALESGNEADATAALTEIAGKIPDKGREATELSALIEGLTPDLQPGLVSALRLAAGTPGWERKEKVRRPDAFDWTLSLGEILARADKRGFELHDKFAIGSGKISIPPNSKTKGEKNLGELQEPLLAFLKQYSVSCNSFFSWKERNLAIFVMSDCLDTPSSVWLDGFLNLGPSLVVERALIAWIIDDSNELTIGLAQHYGERAKAISKGLRNPLVFVYTESAKIPDMLSHLLAV